MESGFIRRSWNYNVNEKHKANAAKDETSSAASRLPGGAEAEGRREATKGIGSAWHVGLIGWSVTVRPDGRDWYSGG